MPQNSEHLDLAYALFATVGQALAAVAITLFVIRWLFHRRP